MIYLIIVLIILAIILLIKKNRFSTAYHQPSERDISMQALFERCAKKYNNDDIKKMKYSTADKGNENPDIKVYSMGYNKNIPELYKYCGPDWTFYEWKSAHIESFEKTRDEIIENSNKQPSINKVGWFGNTDTHIIRTTLLKIGEQNTDLFDIKHIGLINNLIDNSIDKYISLPDLLKYKYLIDLPGNGYSGRLKYLLFSKRPLLISDRDYIEYYHNELIPYKHYVPVKHDLSDLLTQVQWLLNNELRGIEIAKNAFEFATTNFTQDKISERIYYVYNNLKNN